MKPQKVLIFISVLLILLVTAPTTLKAQKNVKAGVVRIENIKLNEIGAGFIVKIVDTRVYVVTAAHVVRGERSPRVYLFDGRGQALSATVIDREDDDVKGLALLEFSPTPQTLPLLTELKLAAATSDFGNGESVTFIGFPGTSFWTVDTGNIKRLEGKNLVLSGSARQGNSGGPVVFNQHVVGLVTDVNQSDIFAARAEIIAVYVNSFITNRITLADKNAEIEATNKKISEANETIQRTFKAGNDAMTAASAASKAKNSEEAIQKFTAAVASYDEGLAADAEQPAILTNKAVALKGRGVERFNATIMSKTLDEAGRSAGLQAAKEDFKAAAEAAGKAVTMIKAQPVPTEPNEVQRYNANQYAAMLTYAESMRLYVSKVDGRQADAGIAAFRDYLAVETDPAKKAKAKIDMANMLLDADVVDKAFTEFKAILATTPDSPEANLGAGLAGYATGDKTKFQEAANFLQRFLEVAPDSHLFRDDAKSILAELRGKENVTPKQTNRPAPKRP
jgi:S1-C subfamily serine protease